MSLVQNGSTEEPSSQGQIQEGEDKRNGTETSGSAGSIQMQRSSSGADETAPDGSLPYRFQQEDGTDCYGDERQALLDFERFFNNQQLSDVTLVIGEETSFHAHKLVLVKSSEVFERMLSQQWKGESKKVHHRSDFLGGGSASAAAARHNISRSMSVRSPGRFPWSPRPSPADEVVDKLDIEPCEIELVEDRLCVRVFPAFLRFLYCSHIVLHFDNTLPVLILADKYNVLALRKVCLNYAMDHIIPNLPLKEVFHVWFQYGTKCFHQGLIGACVNVLASKFTEIMSAPEWEREWTAMDKEQLAEFLKSSELCVTNEYELWLSVVKWITAPAHPERQGTSLERNLSLLLPLIRFPLMTPDELTMVEKCPLVDKCPKIFNPQLLLAYKFNSLPLSTRAGAKEFSGTQFLLREYTDLRWDKRMVIPNITSLPRNSEVTLRLETKASAYPDQNWSWELKLHPKGFGQNGDEFHVFLTATNLVLDQTRPVDYQLQIVDDKRVLKTVSGRKNFTKTRYSVDVEMEKRVALDELLSEESGLLVDDALYMQLTLKPIDY